MYKRQLFISTTAYTLYSLHPYEYIYYNQFAGNSFKKAIHDWEGDYWSSSLIEATTALEKYIDLEQQKTPNNPHVYSVAVCAEAFQGRAYLDKRFTVTEDWVVADFFISSTIMHCDKVLQGKVIASITVSYTHLDVYKRQLLMRALAPASCSFNTFSCAMSLSAAF